MDKDILDVIHNYSLEQLIAENKFRLKGGKLPEPEKQFSEINETREVGFG
jgi:hypothetical protein